MTAAMVTQGHPGSSITNRPAWPSDDMANCRVKSSAVRAQTLTLPSAARRTRRADASRRPRPAQECHS